MKYLLVIAVVLIGFYVWRSSRQADRSPPPSAPPPGKSGGAKPSIEMVQCAHCGIHCPSTDAIAGKHGVYCTAQHRRDAEP